MLLFGLRTSYVNMTSYKTDKPPQFTYIMSITVVIVYNANQQTKNIGLSLADNDVLTHPRHESSVSYKVPKKH